MDEMLSVGEVKSSKTLVSFLSFQICLMGIHFNTQKFLNDYLTFLVNMSRSALPSFKLTGLAPLCVCNTYVPGFFFYLPKIT